MPFTLLPAPPDSKSYLHLCIASSKDALRISEIGDDLFCASPKAGEIWMKIRFLYSLPPTPSTHHLEITYYVNFLGRLGSNGFQLKWRFGTLGNWKKSKSWGPFWSYQLNSTANSAHLAHFWGKWAGLPWLQIIHLTWKTLISGCPHFPSIIIHL